MKQTIYRPLEEPEELAKSQAELDGDGRTFTEIGHERQATAA